MADSQNGEGGADIVEFYAQGSGHRDEAPEKAGRIQAVSSRPALAARRQIRKGETHPTLTRLLEEWAARARVSERRMVAKANTLSVVQAMCTVRGRQGVSQGVSQDATRSRGQALSVQRKVLRDESKTAATERHDLYPCRSEICWQIRQQARQQGNTIVTMERVRKVITFDKNQSNCAFP